MLPSSWVESIWFLHYRVHQFGHDIAQLLLPFGLNVQYITRGCIDQILAMPLRSVIVLKFIDTDKLKSDRNTDQCEHNGSCEK